MLSVKNLTVRFAGLTAVSDLSFEVRAGEIFTIMGPNGAGKTTAFNAIGGFVAPTDGVIEIYDQQIVGRRPENIAALGIRRTFQTNGILREMTVLENVLTGLELDTPSSFLGALTGWPASARAERLSVKRAREVLSEMDILNLEDRVAGDLSFGQQRMVEISRALAARARLIMLDEPAVGLSLSERAHLGRVLKRLAQSGIAVLLVDHVQDLVMSVSDQVLVMNNGKKIAQSSPEAIRENKDVLDAYLGYG